MTTSHLTLRLRAIHSKRVRWSPLSPLSEAAKEPGRRAWRELMHRMQRFHFAAYSGGQLAGMLDPGDRNARKRARRARRAR